MILDQLPNLRAVILDMDGVLYREDTPIGNLPSIFARMDELGFKVIMATNNAMKTPALFQEKLAGFGVHVDETQIINSSLATAQILRKRFPQGGPVYIYGEVGLTQALQDQGFFPAQENVLAVVAGMNRSLTYKSLGEVANVVRSGVPFYGTNPDATFPTPNGLLPGAGTVIAAIEVASGVKPILCGKPYPAMMQIALERLGTLPEETLIIGDRLDTDILWGVVLFSSGAMAMMQSPPPAPDNFAPHAPASMAA